MSCKLASLQFCYHILNKWKDATIYGVCGFAKDENREDTISHYWLEINGIAVDLTADQYNTIDDGELNKAIIKNRPFEKYILTILIIYHNIKYFVFAVGINMNMVFLHLMSGFLMILK